MSTGGRTIPIPQRKRKIKDPDAVEGSWRKKVHPLFVRICEENKTIHRLNASPWKKDRDKAQELIKNPSPDLLEALRKFGLQKRDAGEFSYDPASILGLEGRPEGYSISNDEFMLHWLSWFKYGITWEELQQERNRGNWKASLQLMGLLRDLEEWWFGDLDPEKIKTKFRREDFNLMAGGLLFGFEGLTGEEMASCFDALCPCGKSHDPENLLKLRIRVKK